MLRTRTSIRVATLVVGALVPVAVAASSAFAAGDIGYGDTGSAVTCVQSGMNLLENAGLATDGIYGTLTENAVKNFQANNGLSRDGIVGPDTGTRIKTDMTNDAELGNSSGYPNNDFDKWLDSCNDLLPGSD